MHSRDADDRLACGQSRGERDVHEPPFIDGRGTKLEPGDEIHFGRAVVVFEVGRSISPIFP